MNKRVAWPLAVLAGACAWCNAWPQNFPTKPVRIITSEAGGGLDLAARLVAGGVSASLHQPVVVDNRNGLIAIENAAKALPDGYTLLFNGSVIWLTPMLRANAPWDAIKDFAPVTLAATSPNVLVVHPSVAVGSVKELITLAQSKPGTLNYASSQIGGSTHIAAELFKSMAKVNLVRVPYRGNGPALNAMIGGQTQVMFPNAGAALPHIHSGKLKALGVTSAKPSALVPDLPPIAASGLSGYESVSIYGVFAPAKTPAAVIDLLNRELNATLNAPDVRRKFFDSGAEVAAGRPSDLGSLMRTDMQRMSKLIKEAGIRDE